MLLASFICCPRKGRADDTAPISSPHRIAASLGFAPLAFFSEPCSTSEPCNEKGPKWGGRADYLYLMSPQIELGGGIAYFPVDRFTSVFVASGILRAALLGDEWPVGLALSLRLGSMVMMQAGGYLGHDTFTLGPAAAVGPDVRIWVSDLIGFQLSADAELAFALSPGKGGRTGGYFALSGWLSGLARF
jgi:hypothetical protein